MGLKAPRAIPSREQAIDSFTDLRKQPTARCLFLPPINPPQASGRLPMLCKAISPRQTMNSRNHEGCLTFGLAHPPPRLAIRKSHPLWPTRFAHHAGGQDAGERDQLLRRRARLREVRTGGEEALGGDVMRGGGRSSCRGQSRRGERSMCESSSPPRTLHGSLNQPPVAPVGGCSIIG